MQAVVGVMLMFVGISSGVRTYCDGRQDGVQCFGALGGTVVLQLMDDASEIHRYEWKKDGTIILNGRKNTIITNTMETRSVFIPSNGTFLINNLIKTDSGQYTLKLQDSDGRETGEQSLQLFIQAPVSSVLLVSECLSEGQMKVSCSSEGGDSPQYSWTLDGNTLTDSELLSGTTETNIIILKQNLSGRLVCSVRNHISRVSNELMVSVCRDLSLLRCALMAVVAVVSFIGIGVYFKWKKTKYKKVEASAAAQRTEYPEEFSVTEL
ncbi:hepatic and glial cell adhesion molecule-like [Cololabis saira]|uniref:hepatic and glial cell adhesion molecule-like n=1 Tax=Cololabis saira TaxID=129043 RepID=UPI002AD458D6|nr:hepatic and glial cell adhesion molecule-like [Cololabis saira]